MNTSNHISTVGIGSKVAMSAGRRGNRVGYGLTARRIGGYALAAALWLTGAGAASAQPTTGIDNAVVRINTLGAVNEEVIPFLAEQAGIDDIEIPGFTLYDQTFNFSIAGFQLANVRFRSRVGDVNISLPVDDETFAAAFAGNGAANTGSVTCAVDIPDATLSTSLHLTTSCSSPLVDWLPANIRSMFRISESFYFDVEGVQLDLAGGVTRSGNNLRVQVSSFSASVDDVSIEDSGYVTEVINFFGRGACQVFGQSGTCTVNQAATKLANALLKRGDIVKNEISNVLTAAVKNQGQFGATSPVPMPDGQLAIATVSLQSLHTRANPNRMMTDWSLGFSGSGEAFPDLAYTYQTRGAQTPANEPIAGDMQVWLPLSMFDKAMYELLQSGVFSEPISTPAFAVNIGGRAVNVPTMALDLVNPSVPRAMKAPGTNDQVLIQFTGGLQGGGGSATANLQATIQARVRIQTTGTDIRWELVSATVTGLTGSVSLGGLTIALPAAVTNSISSAVQDAVSEHASSTRLIRRAVALGEGWELQIGTVNIGTRYVRVPLTVTRED
jgi:hypothetical protein